MVGACVVESETETSQSLVLMLPSQVKIEKEKVTIRASKQVPGLRGRVWLEKSMRQSPVMEGTLVWEGKEGL